MKTVTLSDSMGISTKKYRTYNTHKVAENINSEQRNKLHLLADKGCLKYILSPAIKFLWTSESNQEERVGIAISRWRYSYKLAPENQLCNSMSK